MAGWPPARRAYASESYYRDLSDLSACGNTVNVERRGADTDTVVIAMRKTTIRIPISDIILDEEIYPRGGVDQRRVGIFAENIRDGFKFDPIEVQTHPDLTGKYRIVEHQADIVQIMSF